MSEFSSLPDRLHGSYWEISPANADLRDWNFDRCTATPVIPIQHREDRDGHSPDAVYRGDRRVICMPPFELFFSAQDDYHALAPLTRRGLIGSIRGSRRL